MKNIFILLITIISFQAVIAQETKFGVKGGANLSSFIENQEGPFDYNYKFGLQIGGFAKIELIDRFYIQPELMYSLQGTKFNLGLLSLILPQTGPGDDPIFEDNLEKVIVNESTIILPVMLKYYFTDQFNVELGPQIDYLFNVKNKIGNNSSADNSESKSEFNFGINLGLGYDFTKNWGFGIRYNYGFNRFKSEFAKKLGAKRNNSVFSLSLAYIFN